MLNVENGNKPKKKIKGIVQHLPDSRHILAYSNNYQIVLLDNTTYMLNHIDNPFGQEPLVGARFTYEVM